MAYLQPFHIASCTAPWCHLKSTRVQRAWWERQHRSSINKFQRPAGATRRAVYRLERISARCCLTRKSSSRNGISFSRFVRIPRWVIYFCGNRSTRGRRAYVRRRQRSTRSGGLRLFVRTTEQPMCSRSPILPDCREAGVSVCDDVTAGSATRRAPASQRARSFVVPVPCLRDAR